MKLLSRPFLFLLIIFSFFNCSSDENEIMKEEIGELNKRSYYSTYVNTTSDNSNWMSNLDGEKKITEFSIPGTHNTAARFGGNIVECQSMNIEEQLKSGIRYMEARSRVFGDVFTIHHEAFYQKINFGHIINKLKKFLKENPTETIFLRVKQEYSSESDSNFIKIFNEYMDKHGRENFYLPNYSCSYPKLNNVRGKIVILANVYGLPGISWRCAKKQDDYYVSSIFARWSKYKKVEKHILSSNIDYENLYINFSSGSSGGAYPYTVASYVNYYLNDFLKNRTKIKTGIIAMDYPGDELINSIIISNFK